MRFGKSQEPVKWITQIWGGYAADPNYESGINQAKECAAVCQRQQYRIGIICVQHGEPVGAQPICLHLKPPAGVVRRPRDLELIARRKICELQTQLHRCQ